VCIFFQNATFVAELTGVEVEDGVSIAPSLHLNFDLSENCQKIFFLLENFPL